MSTVATSSTSLPGLRERSHPAHWNVWFLCSILLLAFMLRLAWRVHQGGADFWINGYSFFYDLGANLAGGKGLCIDGAGCAVRMPLYPSFLALTALAGKNYLWIVVPQALMGLGTVFCAFLIGKELFSESVGLLASALTAFYPYYLVHDTALQETGMFTFLTALSVFLLLRARRSSNVAVWTAAGVALGAAVLTRQTLLLFSAGALAWIFLCGDGSWGRKLDRLVAIAAPLCMLVGLWVARNYMTVGTHIVTSEFGRQLWNANNPKTFSHYPNESIDRSADEAFAALSLSEQQELDGISDEVVRSHWFESKALDYIKAHRLDTIRAAGRKILAGFSWSFNPVREPVVQWSYLVSYGPIAILGILGMSLSRRQWKEHSLLYLLFLTFTAVTAVFWAHTSHRSYLDVYWIVFAAYVLNRAFSEGFRRLHA
jgi:4-amino-4-deoxy-L-arabinose transferase-like glycosyltransferase